jgi:hypothetical protein
MAMSTGSRGVRNVTSSILLALGVMLTALGVVLLEAHQSLLTPDGLARRCEAERGLKPTVLAVDFYRTGDLVSVVRALNQ